MKSAGQWDERTLDLAFQRFTSGLRQRDRDVLERRVKTVDLEGFELAITAIHLAHLASLHSLHPPPAELMERLRLTARGWLLMSWSPALPPHGGRTAA